MDKKHFTDAEKLNIQQTVLSLLKSALFGVPYTPVSDTVDYNAVFEECKCHSVEALCYPIAEPYLDEELKRRWRTRYRKRIADNIRVEEEHAHVDRLMRTLGIPYVTMKGVSAAQYYPSPELRVMGDVDFLIDRSDLEACEQGIFGEGFVLEESEPNKCHRAYCRGEIIWEMHWEPNGIPNNMKGERIRHYLEGVIAHADTYETEEYSFKVTSPFYNGLIQLVHITTHMINTGVGLRHICDWAMFVASMDHDTFVSIFEEPLKDIGLWRFACLLTQLCIKYLGCPERAWAGEMEDAVIDSLLEDVFNSGNFGIKDDQRINQAKLMTDRDNGNMGSGNALTQLLRSVNYKTKMTFPLMKKAPFLLPFGWVIVSVRHLFKIKAGKRPSINVSDVFSGARERAELYNKLNLFE